MRKLLSWIAKLLGNKTKEKVIVAVFILLLLLAASKAFSGEGNVSPFFEGGATIAHVDTAPIAGFGLSKEFTARLTGDCEIGLIGSTQYRGNYIGNNAFVSCMPWLQLVDSVDMGLGLGILQNKTLVVNSHGVFRMGMRWEPRDNLFIQLGHFSNAGTKKPNKGWNWLSVQKVW